MKMNPESVQTVRKHRFQSPATHEVCSLEYVTSHRMLYPQCLPSKATIPAEQKIPSNHVCCQHTLPLPKLLTILWQNHYLSYWITQRTNVSWDLMSRSQTYSFIFQFKKKMSFPSTTPFAYSNSKSTFKKKKVLYSWSFQRFLWLAKRDEWPFSIESTMPQHIN